MKKVPEELNQVAKKLGQEIDNFEEAVLSTSTVWSVGGWGVRRRSQTTAPSYRRYIVNK
jgi:hypothetical protein